MALFSVAERALAEGVARAAYANPFAPERIAAERAALGDAFVPDGAHWNVDVWSLGHHANVVRLTEQAGALAEAGRQRMAAGGAASDGDLGLYEDLVHFYLYHAYFARLTELVDQRLAAGAMAAGARPSKVGCYAAFAADFARFLEVPGVALPGRETPAHLFACFFQLRRAFHYTFTHIVGGSAAAWRLRAAVWESIFTHDLRRYRRALYTRMGDLATLVTGPSGTGKELVARAIGLSRYVPFDTKACAFAEDFVGTFHAVSLSALAPTVIESELFGHRRGAFTGALEDRPGWLEVCGPLGTVFLDELGETDPAIQVKLLRVVQGRTFQRLGETTDRHFAGKVIAATNRDLHREMEAGRFREDLYYRLCSDLITTPSLSELLAGSREELRRLVTFIARRVVGADAGAANAFTEADALADEVDRWIEKHLGPAYAWPGNFRELEQCVRNVLVRGEYRPTPRGGEDALARAIEAGNLSADELVRRYCAIVYARTGSYEETARRVGLDRRTVKARVSGERADA